MLAGRYLLKTLNRISYDMAAVREDLGNGVLCMGDRRHAGLRRVPPPSVALMPLFSLVAASEYCYTCLRECSVEIPASSVVRTPFHAHAHVDCSACAVRMTHERHRRGHQHVALLGPCPYAQINVSPSPACTEDRRFSRHARFPCVNQRHTRMAQRCDCYLHDQDVLLPRLILELDVWP